MEPLLQYELYSYAKIKWINMNVMYNDDELVEM